MGTITRKLTITVAAGFVVAMIAMPGAAQAKKAGDILIRLRAVDFAPDASGGVDGLGGEANINEDYVPELDFTYFFTDNIAAELILATTRHRVFVNGSTAGNLDLGKVSIIPPVLTLQWHFTPREKISPYVGAGINFVLLYDQDNGPSVTSIDYDNSFGYAFQVGIDYQIDDTWLINADVKKVFVETDITTNAGNAPDTDLDPWVLGIGIGYRF